MNLSLFNFSTELVFIEVLSVRIKGIGERALLYIGDGNLEFFFIKIK